ncbi:MAG: SUMF1/EgtB/PvdO family nonheme iron enzyme [Phycisphaerales bacterium]|nr:SUMF1/EgtB/PvdO family nonheme iron enzyme [Phycisphaerales bacterium]
MSAKSSVSVAALAVVTGLVAPIASASITIPTVPIGNPGNAADPLTGSVYGSVGYTYNIGTTEVTNAQYTAFLNAVAASDPNSLYNPSMAGTFGGITRSGSAGAYTYTTISGRANNPVNFVSFGDAVRFANWLHNGQPTGGATASTTEDGAYTLASGINAAVRNAGWRWAVTSENEWYKAAYFQPASQGGDADSYWLYPTSGNSITTAQANYDNVVGNTVAAGSYAPAFSGAFDLAGNVFEWNETSPAAGFRGIRGGAFGFNNVFTRSDAGIDAGAGFEADYIGFRVSAIPGPSSAALLAVGGMMAARRRR